MTALDSQLLMVKLYLFLHLETRNLPLSTLGLGFNWQTAVANAQERTPTQFFDRVRQRRSEWQDLRNRKLHKAYITPLVPGDWFSLVKTQGIHN